MRFFKKDTKNKNLIVLDIGSQSVKALLLEVNTEERKKNLLGWAKEKSFNDFEKLLASCQKAIGRIEKKTGIRAEEIFLGTGGDLLRGVSTTFCYKREDPVQKIDLAELRNIVQKTQWRAYEKIRKDFAAETGTTESETRLVNACIVDIKIDGEHIPNPVGFEGETICLTIFNNYTSRENLDALMRLSAELGFDLRGINSQSYALFYGLGAEGFKDDILIIDIGGNVTDVVLVKNKGEVIDIKNFNLGGHLFTKTLSDFLGLNLDEAEVVKAKYSRGEVSDSAKQKLDKLFSSNVSSWFNGIKVVLDDFYQNHKSSPKNILLCGGGSFLPGMEEILKKRGGFKTKIISPAEITKINNKTKLQDIGSLALASLASESPESNEFSSLLKRAIRLIQS